MGRYWLSFIVGLALLASLAPGIEAEEAKHDIRVELISPTPGQVLLAGEAFDLVANVTCNGEPLPGLRANGSSHVRLIGPDGSTVARLVRSPLKRDQWSARVVGRRLSGLIGGSKVVATITTGGETTHDNAGWEPTIFTEAAHVEPSAPVMLTASFQRAVPFTFMVTRPDGEPTDGELGIAGPRGTQRCHVEEGVAEKKLSALTSGEYTFAFRPPGLGSISMPATGSLSAALPKAGGIATIASVSADEPGDVSVAITDASGGPLPNVTVGLWRPGFLGPRPTGYIAKSDEWGIAHFFVKEPGKYEVRVGKELPLSAVGDVRTRPALLTGVHPATVEAGDTFFVTVLDGMNKQPVVGAVVRLDDNQWVTGMDGMATGRAPFFDGTRTITAYKDGYVAGSTMLAIAMPLEAPPPQHAHIGLWVFVILLVTALVAVSIAVTFRRR